MQTEKVRTVCFPCVDITRLVVWMGAGMGFEAEDEDREFFPRRRSCQLSVKLSMARTLSCISAGVMLTSSC
jgi:hypothetical protein